MTVAPIARHTTRLTPLLLGAGLGGAIALRMGVAGRAGATSAPAGIAFAAALLLLAVAGGWRPGAPTRRGIGIGIAGAAVLLAVPFWLHLTATRPRLGSPADALPLWAAVVSVVAVAEEALLRGALMGALLRHVRPEAAVVAAAFAFAALHIPLYGWTAMPLDVAVGVWLGGLRLAGGGVTAPAVAHSVADLATWWLR